MPTITILCAMQAEADPIIRVLGLKPAPVPWKPHLPPRLWSGSIHLVTNGIDPRSGADLIGTTPATLAAQLVLHDLRPDAILVAGTAGGDSRAHSIGDVLLIDRAYHHDRRIPLPEFADYAHGPEPLHNSPDLAAAFRARTATISTGNALDMLPQELAFFRRHHITVKDMETASVAWTAGLHHTPVMAVRSITDFFDHPEPETQFIANFGLATEALARSIEAALPLVLAEPPRP